MSADNSLLLTDLSTPDATNRWSPRYFYAYQLRDYLDFQARYATGDPVSCLRLMSNQDVHLYGELVLHVGAIRASNTVSLHCIDDTQDIVSFRYGSAPGFEALRLQFDNAVSPATTTLTAAARRMLLEGDSIDLRPLDSSLAADLAARFSLVGAGTSKMEAMDEAGVYRTLSIAADTIEFEAFGGASPDIYGWGSFSIDGSDNRILQTAHSGSPRPLIISGAEVSIQAVDGTPEYQALTLTGATIDLEAAPGGTGGTVEGWGQLSIDNSGNRILEAQDGGTAEPLVVSGEVIIFRASASGTQSPWGRMSIDGSGTRLLQVANVSAPQDFVVESDTFELKTQFSIPSSGVFRWGRFGVSGASRVLTVDNDASPAVRQPLEFRASTLNLNLDYSGTAADWGTSEFFDLASTRNGRLHVSDPFWLRAKNLGTSAWKNIYLLGCHVYLIPMCTSGKVVVSSAEDASTERASISVAGVITASPAADLTPKVALDATATSGGKKWELSSIHSSGSLKFVNATDGGTPTVEITPTATMKAGASLTLTAPSSTNASVELDASVSSGAKKWELRSAYSGGSLKFVNVTDGGSPTVEITPTATMKAGASLTLSSPSGTNAFIELDATVTSGAKKWELRSAHSGGSLKFVNLTDGGTPTVEITSTANIKAGMSLTLTAASSNSASVELDSTATGGAKKWEVRSSHSDGTLRFTNVTDSKVVKATSGGSLYADEYLGTSAVSAAPSDSAGQVGAHVIDTNNKRIWVKVTDSGSNRWWCTSLTSP